MKIFIWRALHGTVPLKCILANRHCRLGPEDVHLLFQCPAAKDLWNSLRLMAVIDEASQEDRSCSGILEVLLRRQLIVTFYLIAKNPLTQTAYSTKHSYCTLSEMCKNHSKYITRYRNTWWTRTGGLSLQYRIKARKNKTYGARITEMNQSHEIKPKWLNSVFTKSWTQTGRSATSVQS